MPTGVVLAPDPQAENLVDAAIAEAKRAFAAGVRQIWLGQRLDADSLALSALIGAAVPGLGVGTYAVPINPRHPLIIASLAQTAQAAAHGNFSLGLALGGHELERQAFGISAANTLQRLREHLVVLRSVLDSGAVEHHGDEITAAPNLPVHVPGGTPIPIYVAAMGPKALRVAGELADGTLPNLAGPRTIAEFIKPTIDKAAADSGRPTPRIIAAVPVLVSGDIGAAREVAAERLSFYASILSYQKVIAREGLESVVDLAAIGSAEQVTERLHAYLAAGATDVVVNPLRTEEADLEALWAVARSIDAT
ncbi:LLM class F420-dependent oxidoreductase [Mycolicibacterium moriokaense]|uniref:LLM class F420-dependent oxidoreductase n=1 Tax=Mycolicibacterium moriokaense TaxID=39691 RepID=A0AAD1M5R2_9MYCO|nr:TIGR03564 family F420-dependent LLM class oxidoreductase [Mycolicibacterium moriokaense]MCV7040940.1 TIGR03564 family F420-dependent LLM class oxidoreductase [Mycolicibacterium moriokaense]ORB21615.1 LLM class F420-dependent oxidoreductase [Mycolicibacterium moriokaense]BBX00499.1 LLM class F420-dependent oxidoreductase [Mycolicibacterium moriokaense]